MSEALLEHASGIRLGFFLGIFALMALWEVAAPRRPQALGRWTRWPANLGIVVLNTVLLRVLLPAGAVGLALLGEARGWGLLNNVALPRWAVIVASVMVHAVPLFWRLHRMHHADLEFDVTTGARFHPIEILLSMGIKLAVIAALGASAVGVLIFEIVLNGTSMFNHGNVRIAAPLDRVLRWFVVTPDMHRVHHSIDPAETNSNFGFNLPWWDRLFGTYRAQPAAGHQAMTIGIEQFREPRELRLDRMLLQPLRGEAATYPLGRRPGGTR
jgi:sterol desaturase/sphingolipid hydroxylase (fatty acid hydroxylase superfamily)